MTEPRPHTPSRPLWFCTRCPGVPWPCPAARTLLRAEFEPHTVQLAVYMAMQMYDALQDLTRLNPNPRPDSEEIFERFISWTAREPLL